MMTIIGLAQNFVGSNNMNLLQPLGQFGTRLHGGKDSASPRYIFTMLRYAGFLIDLITKCLCREPPTEKRLLLVIVKKAYCS